MGQKMKNIFTQMKAKCLTIIKWQIQKIAWRHRDGVKINKTVNYSQRLTILAFLRKKERFYLILKQRRRQRKQLINSEQDWKRWTSINLLDLTEDFTILLVVIHCQDP